MDDIEEQILANSSFMRFLPRDQFDRLRQLFQSERHEFGDAVVKQGDAAEAYFLLVSGRLRVIKTSGQGPELALNVLRPGDGFGESALADGGLRNATVRCSTAAKVLRLDRSDFLKILQEYPSLKDHLESAARLRALHGFLYEYSNFGRLPAKALNALVEKMTSENRPEGSRIIDEGGPPGPMYVIRKGRVRIFTTRNGEPFNMAFYREGDYFGELSVLKGLPRAASAEAVTDCQLLVLKPEVVRELESQYPEFRKLMEERLAQYQAGTEARVPLDFAEELLPAESSVQNKVELEDPGVPAEERSDDPFTDGRGYFRKRKSRIRRFPHVQQIDEMDCGAASLGMVCRHFGRKVSLARIRQLCHTSSDGTSLAALCGAASELGLAARALKVSLRHLDQMPVPSIVHWEGNHWMVLIDVGSKCVRVADPATGIRRLPRVEFEQKWSGYAALFDYTVEFEKAPESRPSMVWIWPFVRHYKTALFQVLLLAGVASFLQLLFPVFTQAVVDSVIVEKDMGLLKTIVLGMVVSLVFLLLSNLSQQYLLSFAAVRIDASILDFLTRRLLALPMSYFNQRRTGDIQRRLDGARQVRQFVVQQGIGGFLAAIQLVGCLLLMLLFSPLLTGVFLITAPLYAGLMLFSYKVLQPLFNELETAHGKYSSQQIDAIKGIEAVKAAGAELAFRDIILNQFLLVSQKTFRSNFIVMSYESTIQAIGMLSGALFLWYGAVMVIQGEMTMGGFVAFNSLTAMAYGAILRTLGIWDQFQLSSVLINRLNDIFEQEPEQGHDRSRLKPVPSLEGRLELRHVGFRYGGPESPDILKDINLEIAPNQTVAIVGRSGCGKTTLVKLLAGLMEPVEGTILYDNQDLKGLNYRDLRRHVGMVLQENHIFDGTILQNIAFGDADPQFDRVLWAAQLANAHDFIMRLPLGYESRIGETGLALSGGQKQRVAIARALYPDPSVLIFDEATSALDTESERAIQNNLNQLMTGRTCIVIAHRLSTIRDAHKIVVLEKGQVAETGSHDELMARRGLYFYLSSQQMSI